MLGTDRAAGPHPPLVVPPPCRGRGGGADPRRGGLRRSLAVDGRARGEPAAALHHVRHPRGDDRRRSDEHPGRGRGRAAALESRFLRAVRRAAAGLRPLPSAGADPVAARAEGGAARPVASVGAGGVAQPQSRAGLGPGVGQELPHPGCRGHRRRLHLRPDGSGSFRLHLRHRAALFSPGRERAAPASARGPLPLPGRRGILDRPAGRAARAQRAGGSPADRGHLPRQHHGPCTLAGTDARLARAAAAGTPARPPGDGPRLLPPLLVGPCPFAHPFQLPAGQAVHRGAGPGRGVDAAAAGAGGRLHAVGDRRGRRPLPRCLGRALCWGGADPAVPGTPRAGGALPVSMGRSPPPSRPTAAAETTSGPARLGLLPREQILALALPVLPLLLLLPDYLGGQPGTIRLGWVLLCCAGCALALALARRRPPPFAAGATATAQATATPGWRSAAPGWLLAGAWTLAAVALSVAKYRAFGDYLAYDTAYYHQVLWNTEHGRFLQGSILQSLYYDPPLRNHFGLHFTPALLLFLPFHALAPHAATLLVLRDILLGLAALPAYRLARGFVGDRAALPLVLVLLLHPSLAVQPVHAFYPLTIALLPLLWALVAYRERRFALFVLTLGLALLVREDVGVAVFGIGLMALADRLLRREPGRGWGWVLVPVVGGLAWLLLCTQLLMPRLGGQASGQAVLSWYSAHGSSAGAIARKLLGDPLYTLQALLGSSERPYYLFKLLRPFALLPLGGVASLGVLPGLAVNLLVTSGEAPPLQVACHYSTMLLPLLFYGSLQALGRIGRWAGDGAPRAVQLAALALLFVALSALLDAYPRQELARLLPPPQAEALRQAAALVPRGAAVAASSHVLPEVAASAEAYALERMFSSRIGHPEYVLYDAA
ncbi:MAG: DUF2079 domain-containing protein, partial [Deltaproteobacteria bacterium]|nr:DUF2079 domain-containing protein [Deltaproteobacteria bacterium]